LCIYLLPRIALGVPVYAEITNLCDYRFQRDILCKHCVRQATEIAYLNYMRDADSPPFDKPDNYDEE
jgi:hypothetical protein